MSDTRKNTERNMNTIDITDLTETELDELLGYTPDEPETFRCPGCGETVEKFPGYLFGMVCGECEYDAPDYEAAGYYDDSWGDHNPHYDY